MRSRSPVYSQCVCACVIHSREAPCGSATSCLIRLKRFRMKFKFSSSIIIHTGWLKNILEGLPDFSSLIQQKFFFFPIILGITSLAW